MKKVFVVFMLIALMGMNCIYASAQVIDDVNFPIYINNEKLTSHECNKAVDELYVLPVRAVAEKLGYEVIWNSEDNSVLIKENEVNENSTGRYVYFIIGAEVLTYGDNTEELTIQYPTYRPITYLIGGVTYMGCGDFSRALDLYFSKNALAQGEIYLCTQEFLRELAENK